MPLTTLEAEAQADLAYQLEQALIDNTTLRAALCHMLTTYDLNSVLTEAEHDYMLKLANA